MIFSNEKDFEESLIKVLCTKGWDTHVLKYPTEEDLKRNWAEILFKNNNTIDRLNDCPLTNGEMSQLIEQITNLRTPLRLNDFIRGQSVSIKRDNPDDKLHFGKEISLKIYNKREIAAGDSTYQIAQQPVFRNQKKVLGDRRGDLMLLINGMPVIHIELKRSGIPVDQAVNQIQKYTYEGVFTGLFSLIQIFVAMNPEETLYFANPGPDGKFNPSYFFHWADFNNERIDRWDLVGSTLLSIPMAHEMIGYYTVADESDGILKVMRSYQYYAANQISSKVAKTKWDDHNHLGGYIWHTTGSGKTLTSFKAAQLVASSKYADKVIFLMDRIELGTQSLREYRAFADTTDTIQDTDDSTELIARLKSDTYDNSLIVTSIQKMSIIAKEKHGLKQSDLEKINRKRMVIIVDECHRSTFGEMLTQIKNTFSRALFFGFTGTPIQDENAKKMNTTSDIFGNELHRYSIADGIRDKNVLGFDPYMVCTFKDTDLRQAVALDKAHSVTVSEALSDQKKSSIYNYYMNKSKVHMTTFYDELGNKQLGIEDYVPLSQYQSSEHQNAVVTDMIDSFETYSQCGKFHAIFATSSIPECIQYYRILKQRAPELKVTCLFDPHVDNVPGFEFKEDGLVEIIEDYNDRYHQDYSIPTFDKMKKDISARLAHKKPYERVSHTPELQIDILIVVNQMLTGFDSKWINTLYMDKLIDYESIIQAFSRTNRVFGEEKPFGIIRYYRKPHTMKENIDKAVKLYSGDKPLGLFVNKLNTNLLYLNTLYEQITILFESEGITNFEALPENIATRKKFAKVFNEFNEYLEAAKIQGMKWDISEYHFEQEDGCVERINRDYDKKTYLILVQRYKELFSLKPVDPNEQLPYEIKPYITEIDTGTIDAEYMHEKFKKYLKVLFQSESTEVEILKIKDELHSTFATLSAEDQKYAYIILHEIESGDFQINDYDKSLIDYINEYRAKVKDDQIHRMAELFGLNENMLREAVVLHLNEKNLNEFGRFDNLIKTADKKKAKEYFEKVEQTSLIPPKVNIKLSNLLKKFILQGGFDL